MKLTLHRYPPVVNEPHVVSVDSIRPLMVRKMELRGNELRQAAYEGRGWGGVWGQMLGDGAECGVTAKLILSSTIVILEVNSIPLPLGTCSSVELFSSAHSCAGKSEPGFSVAATGWSDHLRYYFRPALYELLHHSLTHAV